MHFIKPQREALIPVDWKYATYLRAGFGVLLPILLIIRTCECTQELVSNTLHEHRGSAANGFDSFPYSCVNIKY